MTAGYDYGSALLPTSPVTLEELAQLKITVGMTAEDDGWRRLAGDVLEDQTSAIVRHWRSGIIAHIPNLARHSRALDGTALPDYLERSNRRFEQWILDTCRRPYDQAWLDYQHEIARRHTSSKKNQTDHAPSTAFVPLRDVTGFIAVLNETIKPYLAARAQSADAVERMHRAWCRSMHLQIALWTRSYPLPEEW